MEIKTTNKLTAGILTLTLALQIGAPIAFADEGIGELRALSVEEVPLLPQEEKAIKEYKEKRQLYFENEEIAAENTRFNQLSEKYGNMGSSSIPADIKEEFKEITKIHENVEYILENFGPKRNENKPSLQREINEAKEQQQLTAEKVASLANKRDELSNFITDSSNFTTSKQPVTFIDAYYSKITSGDGEEAILTNMGKSIKELEDKVPQYLGVEISGELKKNEYIQGELLDLTGIIFEQKIGLKGDVEVTKKELSPQDFLFRRNNSETGKILDLNSPLSRDEFGQGEYDIYIFAINKENLELPFDNENNIPVSLLKDKSLKQKLKIARISVKPVQEIQLQAGSLKDEYLTGENFQPEFRLVSSDGTSKAVDSKLVTVNGGVIIGQRLAKEDNNKNIELKVIIGDKSIVIDKILKVKDSELKEISEPEIKANIPKDESSNGNPVAVNPAINHSNAVNPPKINGSSGGSSKGGSSGGKSSSSSGSSGGKSSSRGGSSSGKSSSSGRRSSSGRVGSVSSNESTPKAVTTSRNSNSQLKETAKLKATVSSGTASITVSEDTVMSIIIKAQKTAKNSDIIVEIKADSRNTNAQNISANLPKPAIDVLVKSGVKKAIINSDITSISFDLETLKEVQKQIGGNVTVSAKKVDQGTLSQEAKAAIGERPIYDLTIKGKNGTKVTNFGRGNVSVSIPYTLKSNEKPENIVAYYINANGKIQEIANSIYNSDNHTLSFSTGHFSKFAVGYKEDNTTAFIDTKGHWAKESIEFVAVRRMILGTDGGKFNPNKSMTRGMFVTALGRLAKADIKPFVKSSFTDVNVDSYYMPYVEWAVKNNIINGVGNNKFAPNQPLSHEQMCVIMNNYAKASNCILPKYYKENIFTDNDKISSYAREAVKAVQMSGILVVKNGNTFDPQGKATRAEAATMLKRFVEITFKSDYTQDEE